MPLRYSGSYSSDISFPFMAEAFNKSFNDNSLDAVKTMKADIDRLRGALRARQGGRPNGLAGPAFGPVPFSMWLRPKLPNADLKKGMLGQ
jgi:hypothetical protein